MKKQMLRYSIMTVVSFGLLACGKNFEAKNFAEPPASPAEILEVRPAGPESPNAFSLDSGQVKEEPMVYTDGVNTVNSKYKFIHGRLQVDNFKFEFNKTTRDMSIRGELNFGVTPDAKPLAFVMHGQMLPNKSTIMKVTETGSPLLNVLAAKVTCVNETCEDFFIDFGYKVEKEKAIYVLRVNNITPKEEEIEDFPVQASKRNVYVAGNPKIYVPDLNIPKYAPNFNVPKKQTPKFSPKSGPVQRQEVKTLEKSVSAAPAAKTLKASNWEKTGLRPTAIRPSKPKQSDSGVIRKAGEPKKDPQTKPIRKAGEPKKNSPIKPIRKAAPGTKPVVKAPAIPATKPAEKLTAPPSVSVVEEEVGEDEAIDDTDAAVQLADTDLKPSDIVEMFPELKEEKENADKTLAEMSKGSGGLPPPAMTSTTFLKTLGGNKDLPLAIQDVLKALPPGVNQAVQVAARTNARVQRKLQNGVNLIPLVKQLDPNSGLRILHPEQDNFWGTTELVATVIRIGQWVRENIGNVQLDVADLSDHNGGLQVRPGTNIRTHKSHQHGIDVDLGYVFQSSNQGGRMRVASVKSEEFLIDKQWDLFKELFKENIAQQIYVSSAVKKAICQHLKQTHQLDEPQIVQYSNRIAVVAGHENHFHLRIKCGPEQKLCGPEPKIRPSPCR